MKGGQAMPTVNVKPEIINWALKQTQEEKLGNKLMSNIAKWLDGSKIPTFNQIEEFSKKTNIPLGYFFLQSPPVEQIDLLEYRTIDSIELSNPSRNLIDTIHEMENIQDWMRTYRQDLGFDKLSFVGCMQEIEDINLIAEKIRENLELNNTWFEKNDDARKAFNFIRKQLEECGVVVIMNGIVGKNTHRTLNADEFRAFAMIDDWAPLIFINAADSNNARLFSILHEIVHIWLGRNDLFNDRQIRLTDISDTERICNAVAGELLVPQHIFLNKWEHYHINVFEKITELAKYFRCGEIVVARKALDCKKIEQNIYNQVVQTSIENYKQIQETKQVHGGNYYTTMGSRLDGCLIRALCESIHMGRTTYTEAYRLTNTSRKTFSEIAQHFGGID